MANIDRTGNSVTGAMWGIIERTASIFCLFSKDYINPVLL